MSDLDPPEILHEDLRPPMPGCVATLAPGGISNVTRPDSSDLARLWFDHAAREMVVVFKSGDAYAYQPIAWQTFVAIANAPSAGKAFAHHIRKAPKGSFETRLLDDLETAWDIDPEPEDSLDPYEAPPLPPQIREPEPEQQPSALATPEEMVKGISRTEMKDPPPFEPEPACTHPSVGRGVAPMVRCPDCHIIVARPQ